MQKQYFFKCNKENSWPIFCKKEIRLIEKKIADQHNPLYLINLAGLAIAHKLNIYQEKYIKDKIHNKSLRSKPHVVFLVGNGNNGTDAIASLPQLNLSIYQCTLILKPAIKSQILNNYTNKHQEIIEGNRRSIIDYALKNGCTIVNEPNQKIIENADIIIDALFGIGLNRPLSDTDKNLVKWVNIRKRTTTVLSLDVPTGIDADTGKPLYANDAVLADETMTFIALKPGLLTGIGTNYAGKVYLAPLNLNVGLAVNRQLYQSHIHNNFFSPDSSHIFTNSKYFFERAIPNRTVAFHKGLAGTVCIIGGNEEMLGAIILAGRASVYMGAGKTHLFILANVYPSFDPFHPEIMCHNIRLSSDEMKKKINNIRSTSLAIGPGLGCDDYSKQALDCVIQELMEKKKPTIFDADALNLLANHKRKYQLKLNQIFHHTKVPITILTPHPGEAAKLLGTDIENIENNRLESAHQLANEWSSIVLLKGAGSIIAYPNSKQAKKLLINPTGNCALASAGTGDLLTGIIVSLLAQKVDPQYAVPASCYWHGLSAEILSAKGNGPIGLTANELLEEIRTLRNIFD